jgi:hypothetical protein
VGAINPDDWINSAMSFPCAQAPILLRPATIDARNRQASRICGIQRREHGLFLSITRGTTTEETR